MNTMTQDPSRLLPVIIPDATQASQQLAFLDTAVGTVAPDKALDPDRRETIVAYGNEIYGDYNRFADTVLRAVDTDQLGALQEPFAQFRRLTGGIDPSRLKDPGGVVGWMRKLIGGAKRMRKDIADFRLELKSVADQLDGIQMRLQDRQTNSLHQIRLQDQNYDFAADLVRRITPTIARAKATRAHWQNTLLQERLAAAEAAPTEEKQAAAQRVQDLRAAIETLDQKIQGMEQARFNMIMQGPAIRLVQNSAMQAINQIGMIINDHLPTWKMVMITALGAADAVAGQEMVAANRAQYTKMLETQSAMIGQAGALARDNAVKGMIDVDALIAAQTKIREEIEKADQAAAEAGRVRAEASAKLKNSEETFRAYLARRDTAPAGKVS